MTPKTVAFTETRSARADERDAVMSIVNEQDLGYQTLRFDSFRVTVHDREIVSILRIEELPLFYFISAVGTKSGRQGRGFAARLLNAVILGCQKPIYLYTIIPDFFARFGFRAMSAPPYIPQRSLFACDRCEPERCACMILEPGSKSQI